jgi:hypothetical protein
MVSQLQTDNTDREANRTDNDYAASIIHTWHPCKSLCVYMTHNISATNLID